MTDTAVDDVTRTSEMLVQGNAYTRARLREMFDISDATINTGVFRPKGHDSVWLFVTESKTPDRTQYVDQLEADVLHWQGQRSGRTDALIREHKERGLELLLFYRRAKYEFAGAGFRYEGIFQYVSDEGENPTSFLLRRQHHDDLAIAQERAQVQGAFEPQDIGDARTRTLGTIVRRQGQPVFRQGLLSAYDGRCAVTGCDVAHVLEAAHIYPYQGDQTNVVTNGLLLRADLHTLFDLGWIWVDEGSLSLVVHPSLRETEYGSWNGERLRLPENTSHLPSRKALRWHRQNVARSE